MRLWMLVLLAGCAAQGSGGDGSDEAGDTGTADTGSADTGGTDTGDSGDTGETGTTGVVGGTFEVRFSEEPGSDWRIGLYLTQFGQDSIDLIREYSSVAATGFPQQVEVEIPLASDLVDYGDGAGSAFFTWFVYADADASGSWSEGETIAASGDSLLGFADSTQGLTNVFYKFSFGEAGAEYADAGDGFDLVDLSGGAAITLEGTSNWQGAPNGAPDRVASIAIDEFQGTLLPNRPLDEALGTTFSWTFDAEPDAARIINDGGFVYALEIPLGYVDEDGSEDYSVGDTIASTLCSGSNPVYLLWLPTPDGIEAAATSGLYGLSGGWTAYASTAQGEELLTNTSKLVLSPTQCSLQ